MISIKVKKFIPISTLFPILALVQLLRIVNIQVVVIYTRKYPNQIS